jgi:phage protein U
MTVNQRPRVSKQYTIGADGSVKTYIGQDDYEITLEGYIFNNSGDGKAAAYDGVYPRERMDKLQNIINGQGTTLGLHVQSPYLDMFGIDYLVVTNSEFPQEEGGYGQQRFNITCISDSYADSDKLYSPYFV